MLDIVPLVDIYLSSAGRSVSSIRGLGTGAATFPPVPLHSRTWTNVEESEGLQENINMDSRLLSYEEI